MPSMSDESNRYFTRFLPASIHFISSFFLISAPSFIALSRNRPVPKEPTVG